MVEFLFAKPAYLWLLLSLPVLAVLHNILYNYSVKRALTFGNFTALERVARQPTISKKMLFLFLRLLTLAAVIFALSGLTVFYTGESSEYDFILAIDNSGSMLAQDFEPNRLEAAKAATSRFVEELPGNARVGIVSFSGTSFVESVLTDDRELLQEILASLIVKPVGGTDLGEAIVTSTNLLLTSDKSRAVLLISDGETNVGVQLEEAIAHANRNNVAVHTIGLATLEGGIIENTNVTLSLDESTLRFIANQTQATYNRATNNEDLFAVHTALASSTSSKRLSFDPTFLLILLALALLFIDWGLASTKFRVIP